MKEEGHRQAADQLEKGTAKLQPDTDPEVARLAIEGAWGASSETVSLDHFSLGQRSLLRAT